MNKIIRGVALGVAGGLSGSFAMNKFQLLLGRVFERTGGKSGGEDSRTAITDEESEPATLKAAEKIVRGLVGRELTSKQKRWAEPVMHYGFGASMGALYGLLATLWPREASRAQGLLFATLVWLIADETLVPLVGLSKPPWRYPASSHVQALAAHWAYGLTLEGARKLAA